MSFSLPRALGPRFLPLLLDKIRKWGRQCLVTENSFQTCADQCTQCRSPLLVYNLFPPLRSLQRSNVRPSVRSLSALQRFCRNVDEFCVRPIDRRRRRLQRPQRRRTAVRTVQRGERRGSAAGARSLQTIEIPARVCSVALLLQTSAGCLFVSIFVRDCY